MADAIPRDREGRPLDKYRTPIIVGSVVRVLNNGYGVQPWMRDIEWTVTNVQQNRCVLRAERINKPQRVHMNNIMVVS